MHGIVDSMRSVRARTGLALLDEQLLQRGAARHGEVLDLVVQRQVLHRGADVDLRPLARHPHHLQAHRLRSVRDRMPAARLCFEHCVMCCSTWDTERRVQAQQLRDLACLQVLKQKVSCEQRMPKAAKSRWHLQPGESNLLS